MITMVKMLLPFEVAQDEYFCDAAKLVKTLNSAFRAMLHDYQSEVCENNDFFLIKIPSLLSVDATSSMIYPIIFEKKMD